MDYLTIYKNNVMHIYIDNNEKIIYINVNNGEYNEEKFLESIEYYKNFWILINNSEDKYHQAFILDNIKIYPLNFYKLVFDTLKSLESIYSNKLHSSCVVNNSNAFEIFKPLLNMYKAIRPFRFVSTLDECKEFFIQNKL